MEQQIKLAVKQALKSLGLPAVNFSVEHPADMEHGDYAVNVAMVVWSKLKGSVLSVSTEPSEFKNPRELAEAIVAKLPETNLKEIASEIKVAGPGFINISIRTGALITQVNQLLNKEKGALPHEALAKWGKKVMVEYAHPNTHKQFHIGHLRNICLGESISRLLEAVGTEVVRGNYQGDIGLHIAKALWGILSILDEFNLVKSKSILERIEFLGKVYAKGAQAYEKDKEAKSEIIKINQQIFEGRGEIIPLWQETRQWSLDFFDKIYERVNTKFDRFYFESECQDGVEIAKKALKKGILKESEGAVVFDGSKYGLDTRVFINSQGLPTYEAKELSLAPKEFSEFGEIDHCIHVVGPEQRSFFEVTFKVEELIDSSFKGKQHHKVYGFVNLKSGKMSSREGKVVTGWWLLEEAKNRIMKSYDMTKVEAEAIAVGAVKYAFLKVTPISEISFDFDESISLEGNSGPYLQYTYARAQSVLAKAEKWKVPYLPKLRNLQGESLQATEEVLLRTLYRFEEVVAEAAEELSPNLVANFLYDLAQKYNSFYNQETILKAVKGQKEFRLWLTYVTSEIIKKGLYLLGMEVVKKM